MGRSTLPKRDSTAFTRNCLGLVQDFSVCCRLTGWRFGNNVSSGSWCVRVRIWTNGSNKTLHKFHGMISYLPKEWLLPALHPAASVPSSQQVVVIGSVGHEITPCFPLHTQEKPVMKDSHLAGSNTSMHVVFFQMFVKQLEGFLQPTSPALATPCLQ